MYNDVHMNDESKISIYQPEKLTVAEFRKQMKMALDYCVQGGVIEIDRMGQKFILMYEGRDQSVVRMNHLKDDGESHNIRPDVGVIPMAVEEIECMRIPPMQSPKKISLEPSALKGEFDTAVEAGKSIPKCCTLKNPCKHWQFDGNRELWVNSITGETKEIQQ